MASYLQTVSAYVEWKVEPPYWQTYIQLIFIGLCDAHYDNRLFLNTSYTWTSSIEATNKHQTIEVKPNILAMYMSAAKYEIALVRNKMLKSAEFCIF